MSAQRKNMQPLSGAHQRVTVEEQRARYTTSFHEIEVDMHYVPAEHRWQRDAEKLWV